MPHRKRIHEVTLLAHHSATDAAKPHLLARPTDAQAGPAEDPEVFSADGSVRAEAAESFIENKRIGDRIKFLRQRKSMGLVELGRHTGLSASFLSQLETGRVVPTLRNLARIAMVFSKDLSFFFEPERPEMFRIVRAADRQRQPQTGADEPAYFFESLGQIPGEYPIAPYVAEFLPLEGDRVGREHQHPGAEFLFILDGSMEVRHGNQTEVVEAGDAVYFHSTAIHSYRALNEKPCATLIVTLPEAARAGSQIGTRVPVFANPRVARGSAA
ncbi:helix-turn-helix domain-containing protein [Granulicella cerasi]|uniref:Helix-turn-helix domain-containing protein n=1 Tax=Granulicella cerasi TaxID=741063 RepID=A0ABW1Z8Q3_9BACT|nr:XRE family transcriptional regulator [Granulicella cerasi]